MTAALFALCGATAAAQPSTQTRVSGVVKRGPTQPVCLVDEPCTAPAAHVKLVFSHAGRAPVSTTTNQRGEYAVMLMSGLYSVRIAATKMMCRPEPSVIRVRAARKSQVVNFFIDTGIR